MRVAPSQAFVNKAAMARLESIYRYPVKGLSPEKLVGVRLEPGQTLPADRKYAIENGPSRGIYARVIEGGKIAPGDAVNP